jgi:hypothetical protein
MSDDLKDEGPNGFSNRSLHAKLADEHGQPVIEYTNRRTVPLSPAKRAPTASEGAQTLSSLRGRGLTPELVKGDVARPKGLSEGGRYNLVEKPHIDALLSTGYVIIYNELERLYLKSQTNEGLTPTESKMFAEYVKATRQLATEEREQRAADKADSMMDDELIEAAMAVITGSEES